MSSVAELKAQLDSNDQTIGDVLAKLIRELAVIADDIEELPVGGMGTMSTEEMMALQKIDFSSQKLRDFSSLLSHLSKSNGIDDLTMPDGVQDEIRLEFTTALLAAGQK